MPGFTSTTKFYFITPLLFLLGFNADVCGCRFNQVQFVLRKNRNDRGGGYVTGNC